MADETLPNSSETSETPVATTEPTSIGDRLFGGTESEEKEAGVAETAEKAVDEKPTEGESAKGEKAEEKADGLLTADDIALEGEIKFNGGGKDKIAEFANKHHISKEAVSEFLEISKGDSKNAIAADQKAAQEEFTTTVKAWEKECREDAEYGGEKLDATLKSISAFIDEYGKEDAEDLRNMLNVTGAGSRLSVFRTFARAAEATRVTEGKPADGNAANSTQQPYYDLLYK